MITADLATALAAAGLVWTPRSGDCFSIPRAGLEAEVFVISELTIEPREYPTGTILAFNGTTEWALDSVAVEDVLWLPREDQLRALLGHRFTSLRRTGNRWCVECKDQPDSDQRSFTGDTPADAYGLALLALLQDGVR